MGWELPYGIVGLCMGCIYIFIYIILYYTHNLRHVYIWYKPRYQTSMRQDSPGRNSLQFLQANLIHCLQHTYL
jgi:hypothetical protein